MKDKSYSKEKKDITYHIAIKPKGSLLWYGGYIKNVNPITDNYDYIIVNKVPMYMGNSTYDNMDMKMAKRNVERLKILEVEKK